MLKSIICLLCIFSTFQYSKAEITADDLAAFLDIDTWESEFEKPTCVLEIYKIKDGKIAENPYVLYQVKIGIGEGMAFKILIGKAHKEDKTKVVIATDSSTYTAISEKLEPFNSRLKLSLPKKLKAGDYILQGTRMESAEDINIKKPSAFKDAILLRVTYKK